MKITSYIGQANIVSELNEIFQAYENDSKKGEPYPWRPINLQGWTGSGKTYLGKAIVEQVKSAGFNYQFLAPNAGYRDLYSLFDKIASYDEESEKVSSIPSVILVDEAHSQKILLDIWLALTADVEKVNTIWRQGRCFHFDPINHIWIFASNRSVNKALSRRCRNFQLVENTGAEMKRLASLMIEKEKGIALPDEAMDALVSRLKPFPGDLEEVMSPLVTRAKAENLKKLNAATVTEVLRSKGFFKMGLRRADVAIVRELAKGKPLTANVLRFDCADDKKRDTQERIDWLASRKLVMPVRNGFALSKVGVTYAQELIAANKKAKGK